MKIQKSRAPKNDMPLMETNQGIVLFHPHVPKNAIPYVTDTLNSRWIGHGPKVEKFELEFKSAFNLSGDCMAVGSGTDALHLGYLLAGLSKDDEVLVPLFTCTATNIPLLYIGAKLVFVDVDPKTLNLNVEDLRRKISTRTKMIVCVHYGGLPCDMDEIHEIANEYKVPVLEDAAHALGGKYNGKYIGEISEYTMFSFQAIKHLTTGDGGMLVTRELGKEKMARRLRWFGIDREDKQKGVWENDIKEIGYKYQMTDISAAIGLAGLEEFNDALQYRRMLFQRYLTGLSGCTEVTIVQDQDPRKEHACWLFTILVERRADLQKRLRERGIESGQTHYRNDRYSIFDVQDEFPYMDAIDDKYLILPLHTKMSLDDVDYVCAEIQKGW